MVLTKFFFRKTVYSNDLIFFGAEQIDKMRVQGAWDLMATVLVMSFFTVILMTGSKVDAVSSKNVILYYSMCNFIKKNLACKIQIQNKILVHFLTMNFFFITKRTFTYKSFVIGNKIKRNTSIKIDTNE